MTALSLPLYLNGLALHFFENLETNVSTTIYDEYKTAFLAHFNPAANRELLLGLDSRVQHSCESFIDIPST